MSFAPAAFAEGFDMRIAYTHHEPIVVGAQPLSQEVVTTPIVMEQHAAMACAVRLGDASPRSFTVSTEWSADGQAPWTELSKSQFFQATAPVLGVTVETAIGACRCRIAEP